MTNDMRRSSPDRTAAVHWPALDALRGLAVIGVVAYHLGWISGGFLGVDLFFALSGFLITSLLVREQRDTGRIDLGAFWGRRFRRLLPAVMAMLVGVLVWTSWWGTPAEQAGARDGARWAIPYLANWHDIVAARDYWAAATDGSVFTHLWSLAIEEQFYVVWPIVAWLALRRGDGERRLLVVTLAGTAASVTALVVLHDPDVPSRVYLGTDTRAAALLLGSAMALRPVRRSLAATARADRRRLHRLAVGLGVALGASWWVAGDHLGVVLRGGLPAHSLAAALLVAVLAALSGTDPAPIDGGRTYAIRGTVRRGLEWVGHRSYGIYLWHWPVIVLAERRWSGAPAFVRDLGEIGLSLMLAAISYRLLEQPVRRRMGWARGPRAAWATVAVTAVSVVVVVLAPSGRGSIAGFDAASIGPPVTAASTVPPRGTAPTTSTVAAPPPHLVAPVPTPSATSTSTVPTSTVPTSTTVSPRRTLGEVLWAGDSVAADLAPALEAAFGAAGVGWIDGSGDGMRLGTTDDLDPRRIYTELFAVTRFRSIVWQWSFWDSTTPDDQVVAAVAWLRDEAIARGGTLVVVTPPPVRADLVDPALDRQIELVRDLAADGDGAVVVIDTVEVWGDAMSLDVDGDGVPDRKPDGVHVCPQGAARTAHWLVDRFASHFDDVDPQPVAAWATGSWTTDDRYDTPVGACVALG
ncbi:MAG: acyltransferase [Ilumatobacteraceae bacterium]